MGGVGGMGEVLDFDNALLAGGRPTFFIGAGVLDSEGARAAGSASSTYFGLEVRLRFGAIASFVVLDRISVF